MRQQSTCRPSHCSHSLTVGVMLFFLCYFQTRSNSRCFFKSSTFDLSFRKLLFQKSGIVNMFFVFIFCEKYETRLSILFGPCSSPMMGFFHSVSYCESWTLTSAEDSEALRSLNINFSSFVTSWMNQPILGSFNTVPSFPHLKLAALTVVHQSPEPQKCLAKIIPSMIRGSQNLTHQLLQTDRFQILCSLSVL